MVSMMVESASPEILVPDGAQESLNHCRLLGVCAMQECGGWPGPCVGSCVVEVFGDEMCGCCGDEECEAHCRQIQGIVESIVSTCGPGTGEGCSENSERCSEFSGSVR